MAASSLDNSSEMTLEFDPPPSRSLPEILRFSFDNRGNLYIAIDTPHIFILPKGGRALKHFPETKPETGVRYGTSLGSVSDVLVLPTSFYPKAPFKDARSAGDEMLYLIDSGDYVLRLMNLKGSEAIVIAGIEGKSAHHDGYIASLGASTSSKGDVATFTAPRYMARLKQSALAVLENVELGYIRIRHVDLVTGLVTTLRHALYVDEPFCPFLHSTGQQDVLHVQCSAHESFGLPLHGPLIRPSLFQPVARGPTTNPPSTNTNVDGPKAILDNGMQMLYYDPSVKKLVVRGFHKVVGETFRGAVSSSAHDLSCFVNNDNFPLDLCITAADYSWKVSSDLLGSIHPSLDLKLLVKEIGSCTFPRASIDAFIHYLHLKPLSSVGIDSSEQRDISRLWSHVARMWASVGLPRAQGPATKFASEIVPRLSSAAACAILIDLWNEDSTNWHKGDLLIESLRAQIRNHHYSTFTEMVTSTPSAKNVMLAMHVAAYTELHTFSIARPETPMGLTKFEIRWQSLGAGSPNPKQLLRRPTDFVFSLDHPHDQSQGVVANMLHLYLRWRWFKRMVETGSVKNRTFVLPGHVPPNMLFYILSCIHSGEIASLGLPDAMALLKYRHEFDLTDQEDHPISPFTHLLKDCLSRCFPSLDVKNCFEYLISYHELKLAREVQKVIDFIVAHNVPLSIATLKSMPVELVTKLQG